MVVSWLMPSNPALKGIAGYVPLHTLMETIAIVVAMLVFGVCWGSYEHDRPGNLNLLASIFLGVALLDFLHTLSYRGMPDFVTPGSAEKSIYFWLVARTLSALGLLAVAVIPWRPLRFAALRWLGLVAIMILVALVAWLGLLHPDWLPRTFIDGQGLTQFKVVSEYVLIALFLMTALIFLVRMRTAQSYDVVGLFAAVCIMAMSEFFFTLYADVTDIFNVLGHVYKVIAYGFIYKSIFIDNIRRPFQALQQANATLINANNQRLEAELERDRMISVVEASPDFVGMADLNGKLLYLNQGARAISGLGQRPLDDLRIVDMHPQWAMDVIVATGFPAVMREGIWQGESAVLRLDGSEIPMSQIMQAHRNAQGEVLFFSTVMRDISERKQTEQKLQQLNEELEDRVERRTADLKTTRDEAQRANQAKSEFLSSMSHELRTPMNAILGFGQLLEYDDALSAVQKDNIQEILKAGHHLLNLINEVLDLAKVESGRIDLSLEPVEVNPVVEECLSLAATLAEKRAIRIICNDFTGIVVRADRTRLKQVLLNLLSNAIKYNREGGSVTLAAEPWGADRLRLRIVDTGEGIPAERLEELFQPFNRLDAENSEIEGTGIGLTITRRIIELMGGSVDVESVVGVGSTFWIELPLESLPDLDGSEAAGGTDPIAIGTLTIHTTVPAEVQHLVLYIEDNPANLKLVAQILGRRKHISLLSAHTPELGIELARTRRPELILLDINMPGMDGYQVLEVFKADPLLKDTPVIAITANAMPRDIGRGMLAGFTDYLTKPLNVSRFNKLVDAVLNPTNHSASREAP